QYGVGIRLLDNTSMPVLPNVINSGSISSMADDATGISVGANQFVVNSGVISVGSGGVGVDIAGNGSVLNNYGTIRATSGGNSIEACTCGPANVTFNNMSGGTLDGKITVFGQDNTVNNSGLITITDPSTPIAAQNFNIANGNGNANTNPNIFSQSASGTLALRMDNGGAVDGLAADAVNPGGTLRIVIQPQLYSNTLISTTAAVAANYFPITHSFDTYTSSSPFFTVTPLYDSGDPITYSQLYIQLNRVAFNAVPGLTPNEQAVGGALERGYSTGLTGNAATFYGNLFTASSVGVLDQLSGAGTAAAQDASFSAASLFNNAMMQQGLAWLSGAPGGNSVTTGAPLGYAAAPGAKSKAGQDAFAAMQPRVAEPARWRAWAVGFGGTRSTDGDASLGTADQSTRTAGGAAGVEHQIGDLLLGMAAGGNTSHFSVSSLSTSGDIDGGHVGAYAFKAFGAAYAAATLNYAHFSNKTERTISGIGATENANGSFASDQIGGRFELGWRQYLDQFTLTPFAAIEPAALWQRAYTESSTATGGGSGMLGLSYSAHTTTSLPTFLGAQIDTRYVLAGGQVLSPIARVSWVHEFNPDRQIEASFVSIPSTLFTVDGARAARDSVRLDTGATLALNQSVALFANVSGEFSGESQMASATGGAKIAW
ncbi:MAG TPA: autotransporter outer membrane beta-barrel domain-containing protein, partial [Pseudolabrys sp.]|nr:autotransporter outer membrane beta-barrel domain-containing protein [Pseudolabrys sp.]